MYDWDGESLPDKSLSTFSLSSVFLHPVCSPHSGSSWSDSCDVPGNSGGETRKIQSSN